MKIVIDQEKCIGCGTCAMACEECFEIKGGVAQVKKEDGKCGCDVKEVAQNCPVGAINVEE